MPECFVKLFILYWMSMLQALVDDSAVYAAVSVECRPGLVLRADPLRQEGPK